MAALLFPVGVGWFMPDRSLVLRPFLFGMLMGMLPLSAAAIDIVRCTTRDGDVRYQDRPCASDEAVQTIRLVDDLPRAPASASAAASPTDEAPVEASPVPPPSSTEALDDPRERMAPSHVCQRDDGSRYLSDSGVGERRAVPLAMLGVPGRSLAETYGPRGAGVSAPGVATPPRDRPVQPGIGAAYTWVEDPCMPVSGDEVCEFLALEIDKAETRVRRAFSDTAAQARADLASLQTRAAPCGR